MVKCRGQLHPPPCEEMPRFMLSIVFHSAQDVCFRGGKIPCIEFLIGMLWLDGRKVCFPVASVWSRCPAILLPNQLEVGAHLVLFSSASQRLIFDMEVFPSSCGIGHPTSSESPCRGCCGFIVFLIRSWSHLYMKCAATKVGLEFFKCIILHILLCHTSFSLGVLLYICNDV